jgi:hypothetical protein
MKKLLLKLAQKYLLERDPRHRPDDLILYGDSDYEYEFVAIYYSFELKPFAFIRDPADGKIFGVPLHLTRSPYTR